MTFVKNHKRKSDSPDLRGVFLDGSVAGELAGIRHIDEALLSERLPVGIIGVASELRVAVGDEVKKNEVVIGMVPVRAVDQRRIEVAEHAGAAVVERAVDQGVEHLFDRAFSDCSGSCRRRV